MAQGLRELLRKRRRAELQYNRMTQQLRRRSYQSRYHRNPVGHVRSMPYGYADSLDRHGYGG